VERNNRPRDECSFQTLGRRDKRNPCKKMQWRALADLNLQSQEHGIAVENGMADCRFGRFELPEPWMK